MVIRNKGYASESTTKRKTRVLDMKVCLLMSGGGAHELLHKALCSDQQQPQNTVLRLAKMQRRLWNLLEKKGRK